MGETNIEWTDATWNPIVGCSRASTGCEHCYAERMAVRLEAMGQPAYRGLTRGGHWTGETRLVESALAQPLHWRRPRRVFVCSMGDLFHESVPFEFLDRVYGIMALRPQHTFQVLTKRPERRRAYFASFNAPEAESRGWHFAEWLGTLVGQKRLEQTVDQVLAWHKAQRPNVWEGTTAEDQERADERLPELLATPAAVRFVSVEPMLGPVDLTMALPRGHGVLDPDAFGEEPGWPGLDWVIVGGEAGPGARPCDVAWIRDVVRQCRAAGVPPFVKQLGARPLQSQEAALVAAAIVPEDCGPRGRRPEPMVLKDRKGGDPEEWPSDLRVREWPEVARG